MTDRPERPEHDSAGTGRPAPVRYERAPDAGGRPPAPLPDPAVDEYRLALLRERLATDGQAELGVRVEWRGRTVLLTGTVTDAARREQIVDLARDTLGGVTVRAELAVAGHDAPDHGEELP
ncbi:BON domain-containing protein [Streptomyces sp. NPDC085529]|uniref:BON domain-containing protein n=1 Tax=Streptomyces sp. NPDC085529 TaxID=3365729 RepID=UPI0037CDE4E6